SKTIAVKTNIGPTNGGSHSCSECDTDGAPSVPIARIAAMAPYATTCDS
ncbi:MAG: hypothetical protein ACJAYX_003090, partial [Planctomycetota bacterium]